jgi:hypothetical protein
MQNHQNDLIIAIKSNFGILKDFFLASFISELNLIKLHKLTKSELKPKSYTNPSITISRFWRPGMLNFDRA